MSLAFAPARHDAGPAGRYHATVTAAGDRTATTSLDRLDQAFAAGDADLRAVYDEHGGLVYAICRKALDEHTANDVTQEVFVNAWRAREQFDPARGNLRAWLVGITKRRIVDHLRSEGRHRDRRADQSPEAVDPVSDEPIDRTVDRMIVADALRRLPERSRQVVALAYLDGLTHHEITERTGLPLGTVKSDIRRSLERIRAAWEVNHA